MGNGEDDVAKHLKVQQPADNHPYRFQLPGRFQHASERQHDSDLPRMSVMLAQNASHSLHGSEGDTAPGSVPQPRLSVVDDDSGQCVESTLHLSSAALREVSQIDGGRVPVVMELHQ